MNNVCGACMKHLHKPAAQTLPMCEAVEPRRLLAANLSTGGEYRGDFDASGNGSGEDVQLVIDFDNVSGNTVSGQLDAGGDEFNFTGRLKGRRLVLTMDDGIGDDATQFLGTLTKNGERINGRLVDGQDEFTLTGKADLVEIGRSNDIVTGRGDEAIYDRGLTEEN